MALSCSLDPAGVRGQRERYRRVGIGATIVRHSSRDFVVSLDDGVDIDDVDELLAVERECCPFFDLDWEPQTRLLSVSVSLVAHEPALAAIRDALGLSRSSDGALPR
jgi:hypothetical protein